MCYRHNLVTINTDGDDLHHEFKLIKSIIEEYQMTENFMFSYPFHQWMEREFGKNWRITAFLIIDICASSSEERFKLLKALQPNCYREGEGGFEFFD